MQRFSRLLQDTRGNVALMFALVFPILLMLVFGGIELARASSVKSNLQDALDAAALAVARNSQLSEAQAREIGLKALRANLANFSGATLDEGSVTFDVASNGQVVADATVRVRTYIGGIVLPPYGEFMNDYLNVAAHSQVMSGENSFEIAMVLDVTGSMAGSRLSDLKDAARSLVDIVTDERPTSGSTRVALVPYSNSVNLAGNATRATGPLQGPRAITKVAYQSGALVVTSAGHGLQTGDAVQITGVGGLVQVNNTGLAAGPNAFHHVTRLTANTYSINTPPPDTGATYTSGGSMQCLQYGCRQQQLRNATGEDVIFGATTCVTERTGAQAYTDAAPTSSSARVGIHYAATPNVCLASTITPLTTSRSTLFSAINSYSAEGSTAGHIGAAWGWYALSPSFTSVIPGGLTPTAYRTGLTKIVILMTDGEFNTSYCRGVTAQDSGSGSGSPAEHINCDATNGSSFQQAVEVCRAMKRQDIIIYAIGFDLPGGDATPGVIDSSREVLAECASRPNYLYLPNTGASLRDAFADVGTEIRNLKISR